MVQGREETTSSIFYIKPVQFFLLILLSAGLVLDIREIVVFSLFLLVSGMIVMLWSRFSLKNVICSHTPGVYRVFPGESVEFPLRIKNSKFLPVLLRFSYSIPFSAEITAVDGSGNESFKESGDEGRYLFMQNTEKSFILNFTPSRRGVYALGPLYLEGYDIFGLRSITGITGERSELLVYPRPLAVKKGGIPGRENYGRKTCSSPVTDPLYIRGTRDYQPGSPSANIHWKASARHGKLFEKVFESVHKEKLLIIIDARDYDPLDDSDSFENVLGAVAYLVLRMGRSDTETGFATNCLISGKEGAVVPVSGSKSTYGAILESLARAQPGRGEKIRNILRHGKVLRHGIDCIYFAKQETEEITETEAILAAKKIPASFVFSQRSGSEKKGSIKNSCILDDILLAEEG